MTSRKVHSQWQLACGPSGLSHRQGQVCCVEADLLASLEFSTWAELESKMLTQGPGYHLGGTKQGTLSKLQYAISLKEASRLTRLLLAQLSSEPWQAESVQPLASKDNPQMLSVVPLGVLTSGDG